MRKALIVLAPFGVIALGIAGFILLHAIKPEPKKAEEPPIRPTALFVEEVRREPVTLSVTTQGEVKPLTEIDLVSQVSGRIVWVAPQFVDGGIVAAGAPLIRIEDTDYRFAVKQAEAAVAQAELRLAQEEARAQIAAKQWEWEEIKDKPTALALKQPHVAEARAQLAAAKGQLEQAELNLARTAISVPFQARVRTKSADLGQFVTAGARLGRVFSTESVQVRLPLTDEQLAKLDLPIAFNASRAENGPRVTLSATLAGARRQWSGRIVRTDAAVDPATRLFHAIVEVRDPYGKGADDGVPLPVGLFVTATIEGNMLAQAYVLPRPALRGEGRVYVVTDDNRLSIRDVAVISAGDQQIVVASGVSEGERVVVSAVRSPREGMAVEPLTRDSSNANVAQAASR